MLEFIVKTYCIWICCKCVFLSTVWAQFVLLSSYICLLALNHPLVLHLQRKATTKEDLSASSWKETAVSLSLWERLTWLLFSRSFFFYSHFFYSCQVFFAFIPLNIFCGTGSLFFLLIIHNMKGNTTNISFILCI